MVDKVWVLTHDHKHGTDIYVCANDRSAWHQAKILLRESTDPDPEALELLTDGDVIGAWRAHGDSANEYINIEEHVVMNFDTAVEELASAVAEED